MFEKVNPSHPDKIADRIAGAIVDLAYRLENDPKIAVEVLLGHSVCFIIAESSVPLLESSVAEIVDRLADSKVQLDLRIVPQDVYLAANQSDKIRCGDNGIFKGVPVTEEQRSLVQIARNLYAKHPYDGKYILDNNSLTICQSHTASAELRQLYPNAVINPLGDWTGGINTDAGATNRKLGSDMADSITGGGLHGKDLSKADVSVNIYAFLKAQELGKPIELSCSIGDESIAGVPYEEIVNCARAYITELGGFEKLAEWGLVR